MRRRTRRKLRFYTRFLVLLLICLVFVYCLGHFLLQREHTQGRTERAQVVAYAKTFLGTPYIYGTDGPFTFDCSGFTLFVYHHFNVDLPHSAALQAKRGIAVRLDAVLPGDLLFFNTSGQGVSHTGIYLGGGRFIHASSSKGMVTITSLASTYYQKRLVAVRRVSIF